MIKSLKPGERQDYIMEPLRRARDITAKFVGKRSINGSAAYLASDELATAIRGVLLYVELLEVRVQELERERAEEAAVEEHWA